MKAIIILGPPGSGKGTQANLLANKLGYIHFDTGAYFEKVLYASENKNNKEIQRERKLFENGILLTPSWVLKIIKKAVEKISKAGWGIIFSGSPRTFFEAFGFNADSRGLHAPPVASLASGGDKRGNGLMDTLDKLYGKKNIHIFKLSVPAQASIKRNSARLVCSICGSPILDFKYFSKSKNLKISNCPFCGGNLRKRALDKPAVIKERLKEYANRTQPVIVDLKRRKYKIHNIDGTPLPYKVHQAILASL